MTAEEEFLAILVVLLLITIGKKKWYRFIEKKYPEVDWDREEE